MEKTITVLNCPVDLSSSEEVLLAADNSIKSGENLHIITLNPEMIINAQKHSGFMEIVKNSDINIPDGVGVKIALKLKNIKKEQIRGIDFSRELIRLASENNYNIALLGAKEEIIQAAKENILKKYPDINLVYTHNGYFSNDDDIISEIKEVNPQIILVGLGSPRQEEFIVKLKKHINGCVMIGVGGSFDVFSGMVKESPLFFRKLGLEWLYRTLCQPERFKRIFPVLPIFLIKCIIDSRKGE